jgi:arsenate reductase-like glutaredoxin family protein
VQSTGKDPIEGRDALSVLEGVRHLHVAKGRKVVSFDLAKERPDDPELLGLILGRSGKLRAPVLRTGDTLIVGFNQDLLSSTLL